MSAPRWNWTELDDRILRIVIRFGGRASQAAQYIGCTKPQAQARARKIGLGCWARRPEPLRRAA